MSTSYAHFAEEILMIFFILLALSPLFFVLFSKYKKIKGPKK